MNVVIVGAQWGDEGKGKVVDILTEKFDAVVRCQGGANAGHTVTVDDEQYILHLTPSGILHKGKSCVIGNGVVFDPVSFLEEKKFLKEKGIEVKNLYISDRAHVVMPYHKLLDKIGERQSKIGTTGRGIGPCYGDKVSRRGIRICDFIDEKVFKEKLMSNINSKNELLKQIFNEPGLDFDKVFKEYRAYAKEIKPYVADTSVLVNKMIKEGKRVLFEGAQGTLLDIDHGTFPYVTSSNSTVGGICSGVGVPPQVINKVIGIVKTYTTRVGAGPFPTELLGKECDALREKGGEFGATTGRPRRCGWFDAVIVRHSIRINGMDSMVLTKLDVLSGLKKIKICVGYKFDGKKITELPAQLEILEKCEAEYIEMDGWDDNLTNVKSLKDLPKNAKAYIKKLEEILSIKSVIISVGPKRNQTFVVGEI